MGSRCDNVTKDGRSRMHELELRLDVINVQLDDGLRMKSCP